MIRTILGGYQTEEEQDQEEEVEEGSGSVSLEIRPDSWIVGRRKGTSGCEMPSLRKLSSSLVKVGDAPARTLAIFHFHPFQKLQLLCLWQLLHLD